MKLGIILIIFVIYSGIVEGSQWNGRCDIRQTINITGGLKDQSGNYLHNGIIYSPGTFASVDFIFDATIGNIPAPSHVRGCVCLYKPCIRFCCEDDQCFKSSTFELPTKYGHKSIDLSTDEYGVLYGRPCKEIYRLEPEDYPEDEWNFDEVC